MAPRQMWALVLLVLTLVAGAATLIADVPMVVAYILIAALAALFVLYG